MEHPGSSGVYFADTRYISKPAFASRKHILVVLLSNKYEDMDIPGLSEMSPLVVVAVIKLWYTGVMASHLEHRSCEPTKYRIAFIVSIIF